MNEYEPYLVEASMARSQAELERQDFILVATLGLNPFKDGNMWCFLWGDNLQEGVAGFGKTVHLAACNFSANVHAEEIKT